MLSRLVITFLPRSKHLLISWLRALSAVILEPPKIKSDAVSTVSLSMGREVYSNLYVVNKQIESTSPSVLGQLHCVCNWHMALSSFYLLPVAIVELDRIIRDDMQSVFPPRFSSIIQKTHIEYITSLVLASQVHSLVTCEVNSSHREYPFTEKVTWMGNRFLQYIKYCGRDRRASLVAQW